MKLVAIVWMLLTSFALVSVVLEVHYDEGRVHCLEQRTTVTARVQFSNDGILHLVRPAVIQSECRR